MAAAAAAVAAVHLRFLPLPRKIPRCYETKSTAALELEILDGNTESVLRVALVTIITLLDQLGVGAEGLVGLWRKEEEEEEEAEEEELDSEDRSALLRNLLHKHPWVYQEGGGPC